MSNSNAPGDFRARPSAMILLTLLCNQIRPRRSPAMRARVLILLFFFPLLAQAQLYRWVDDKGNVHFSDRAPVSGAKDLHKTPMPAAQGSSAALPYALQQAITNFPVTLYTSEICKESCAQAREFLNKRGVPYRDLTVKDEADIAQMKKLSGDSVVPVMT